jgi:uncharacterized repeat protein (TIGR03803 family)
MRNIQGDNILNFAKPAKASCKADIWMTLAAMVVAVLMIVAATQMEAQTLTVLHNFTGGTDGYAPYSALTMDRAGNLYGTTYNGGSHSFGGVFKLSRRGSGWLFNPLYGFPNPRNGGNDGYQPTSPVTIGPDGSVYGTTEYGGGTGCYGGGCGVIFNLRPSARACNSAVCPWSETIVHRFGDIGSGDGEYPLGALIFDQAGNMYGTTSSGGVDYGTAFEFSPSPSGWTETILHNFNQIPPDGAFPSGIAFGPDGNLYGITEGGEGEEGQGYGTVFELARSGSGWIEHVLYAFQEQDGTGAFGAPVFDSAGNLFGTLSYDGPGGIGAVFQLSPGGGGWTFTPIHDFTGSSGIPGPIGTLARDAAGNLYGTTFGGDKNGCLGGYGCGNVFELSPTAGGWIYTSLHDFTGGADGGNPEAGVIVDTEGNIYGTSTLGNGNVFEITP